MNKHIGVIGDGSWATALVKLLAENQVQVDWYIRKPESIDFIIKNKSNPDFLQGVSLDMECLHLYDNVKDVFEKNETILLVVPSEFLSKTLGGITSEDFHGKRVVSAIKGIIEERNQTVCNYLHNQYDVPLEKLCVVSGPSHAEEVAEEKLSYLTIASEYQGFSEQISSFLARPYIRTIASDDIFGTEYAATLKNIMALGAGICNGLGYGDNFQAVLISNAIREIKRFASAVHPIKRDINESAYLGDLMVTAYSTYSRNRTFGHKIGQGIPVAQALGEMKMVAEGYHATKCIYKINEEYKVEMPILESVYAILFKNASPVEEIKQLTEKLR